MPPSDEMRDPELPPLDERTEASVGFESLVCRKMDGVMTARGFSAGQGGSLGPVGGVLYCGAQDALHRSDPHLIGAPDLPEWDCYDVHIEGTMVTGVVRADLDIETIEEALTRLGHTALATRVTGLSSLPPEDGLDLVIEAIETLFPRPE